MILIAFIIGLFIGVGMKVIIRIMEQEVETWSVHHEARLEAKQYQKMQDIWGNAHELPVLEEPQDFPAEWEEEQDA